MSSSEDVVIVYPMEPRTCRGGENLLKQATCLMEHYWPLGVQKEKTLDIPLVEDEVFFMARSPRASAEYTLHVSKQSEHHSTDVQFSFYPFLCSWICSFSSAALREAWTE